MHLYQRITVNVRENTMTQASARTNAAIWFEVVDRHIQHGCYQRNDASIKAENKHRCQTIERAMNSTNSIWVGAVLVLAAVLIVTYSKEGMFAIASVFGISIVLIGAGLIAEGFGES